MAADAIELSYVACNVFTRAPLGLLPLTNVTCDDQLRGNGKLTATIFVEDRAHALQLQNMLRLDASSVFVRLATAEQPIWGGILTFVEWDSGEKTVRVEYSHFRDWFFTRLFTPTPGTNAARDDYWTRYNTDQAVIFLSLFTYAIDVTDAPYINCLVSLTGVLRDFSAKSTDFNSVGDAMDTMAHRQRGYDWTVIFLVEADTGLITPTVVLYYPERIRGDVYDMVLEYDDDEDGQGGGNVQSYSLPQSVTDRVSRMWTTGEGTPPDMPISSADSVLNATRTYVYREAKRAYSTVSETPTLNSHARTEVTDRSDITSLCSVSTYLDNPDITRFRVGDRTRLKISDEWFNMDLPSVRILSWSLTDDQNGSPYMRLSLDVTDAYGALVEVE